MMERAAIEREQNYSALLSADRTVSESLPFLQLNHHALELGPDPRGIIAK
jgi:hypothetical protein